MGFIEWTHSQLENNMLMPLTKFSTVWHNYVFSKLRGSTSLKSPNMQKCELDLTGSAKPTNHKQHSDQTLMTITPVYLTPVGMYSKQSQKI